MPYGKPRVLDTDLAAALGLLNPRKIRTDIIEANRAELEGFGPLWSERLQTGGRPGKAFYLNEEQALLVAMFSRTERAKEVRAALVRVFAAWRKGLKFPQSWPQHGTVVPSSGFHTDRN